MRVALGMSGGVDSTVAACLLREGGHTVIGVTMQIWDGPADPASASDTSSQTGCYGPGERRNLENVVALTRKLGIEHHIVPLAAEYRQLVLAYFIDEYRTGRTPNPCVVCNRDIKLKLLPERLRAAGVEFDAFATGHYAQIVREPDTGLYQLRRGADRLKDQSYFLFYLGQRQLSQLVFPLGALTKPEVKDLARRFGLSLLAEAHESQDFMGGEYERLFPPADIRPGPVVDEAGRILGEHRGLVYYTIGQREGLGIAAGRRMFVKELRSETNTVVLADRESVMSDVCLVEHVHWIAGAPPMAERQAMLCHVQLRYRHAAAPAVLEVLEDGRVQVKFNAPQFAITPGQAAVFYRDDMVLGGGWVSG
jgi:tRNA-specific 2-thiouridylase